jgi:O-acetyl-ADP-ribose deacetylase
VKSRYISAMPALIEIATGRIETLAVDAVVNAANGELLPGSGVDGALRAAAGPELTIATAALAPIKPGQAVITPGFAAPARFIIHTAAPIWFAGGGEAEKLSQLAQCYRSVIALAHEHALASLAFPCLGTGNFGWPRELACATALVASFEALERASTLERLIFCCFTPEDEALYRAALG